MRIDRLALSFDAAMLAAFLASVFLSNPWPALVGTLLLFVIIALPLLPSGSVGVPRLLAFAGLLLFLLVLGLAGLALDETGVRLELSEGALPFLAVVAASAGTVGLVWMALWRAIALRPAPWKAAAFAFCLFIFLWSPAVFVVAATGEGDAEFPRLVLVSSASALCVAAALPFVDSAFRPRVATPTGKRI